MELRILNKVVRLTHEGVELEADPRHVELTICDLGLADARVSTVLAALKASCIKSPFVKTATRMSLPVPFGNFTVVRNC